MEADMGGAAGSELDAGSIEAVAAPVAAAGG